MASPFGRAPNGHTSRRVFSPALAIGSLKFASESQINLTKKNVAQEFHFANRSPVTIISLFGLMQSFSL